MRQRWLAVLILLAFVGAGLIWPTSQAEVPALLAAEARADRVMVEKATRRLTLLRDGVAIAVYDIALGFAPQGDKRQEGDGRTPEGLYRVDRRNDKSAYHLSLGLNYPTPAQRSAAAAEGRDPGGDIFIHGQPNATPDFLSLPGDWTAGCIAVSNPEMREIWARVAVGTPVEIRP